MVKRNWLSVRLFTGISHLIENTGDSQLQLSTRKPIQKLEAIHVLLKNCTDHSHGVDQILTTVTLQLHSYPEI